MLLFAVAVIGLRLSERRMLAESNALGFAVAPAVGRHRRSHRDVVEHLVGHRFDALVTLLVAHLLVPVLRASPARMDRRRWPWRS